MKNKVVLVILYIVAFGVALLIGFGSASLIRSLQKEPTVPPSTQASVQPSIEEPTVPTEPVFTDVVHVNSRSYCVLAEDGHVLLSADGEAEMKPASTTKLLTMLLAYESVGLDELVTISPEAVSNVYVYSSGCEPSLRPGEVLTVRDLLYALMLPSTNVAANALAEYVSGSMSAFVRKMNERVSQMGLKHTHFMNPSGLDMDKHYSCAYDLALILKEACQYPELCAIMSAPSYTIPATAFAGERTFTNGHRAFNGGITIPGAFAGKCGWTPGAMGTLTTAVERDGKRIYIANLYSDEYLHWEDAKNLAEHSFWLLQDAETNYTPFVNHVVFEQDPALNQLYCAYDIRYAESYTVSFSRFLETDWEALTTDSVPVNDSHGLTIPAWQDGVYILQFTLKGADQTEYVQYFMGLFCRAGIQKSGFTTVGDKVYYVDANGNVKNGAIELGIGQEYYAVDFAVQYSTFVDNGRYYVDAEGKVVTGPQVIDKNRYYFLPCGEKVTGKILLEGEVFDYGEDGIYIPAEEK